MFHHQVGATTSDTEQSHYPRGCHLGIHTGFFCPSPVLLHGSTFRPLFCTTLLSPAQWIFYEPGNVGFCVEDRNINMAFLHLELLFLLWYKIFQKTAQIGQVATWTALFMSLFLSKGADFKPASLCQTPDVQSTTCTTTWLDEEKKEREREKTLGDYFSLWNWFLQRMSHCLFPSCKFRKDCTHLCQQPIFPLWIHLISHRLTSLFLHVRIISCSAYFSHSVVWISELLCKAIDEEGFLWVADKTLRFQPGRRGSPDTAAYQAGWQSCCLQTHSAQGAEVLW